MPTSSWCQSASKATILPVLPEKRGKCWPSRLPPCPPRYVYNNQPYCQPCQRREGDVDPAGCYPANSGMCIIGNDFVIFCLWPSRLPPCPLRYVYKRQPYYQPCQRREGHVDPAGCYPVHSGMCIIGKHITSLAREGRDMLTHQVATLSTQVCV